MTTVRPVEASPPQMNVAPIDPKTGQWTAYGHRMITDLWNRTGGFNDEVFRALGIGIAGLGLVNQVGQSVQALEAQAAALQGAVAGLRGDPRLDDAVEALSTAVAALVQVQARASGESDKQIGEIRTLVSTVGARLTKAQQAIQFQADATEQNTLQDKVFVTSLFQRQGAAQFALDQRVERVEDELATMTTDDVPEGITNLYYTNARADGRIAAAVGVSVQAYDPDLTTWAGITPGTGVATALGISVGSAGAFVTFNGAGGTPSSLTLTNATNLPISTGVSGLGTGVAAFLATPSSANLLAAITDETGTGKLVFADAPTLNGQVTVKGTGTSTGVAFQTQDSAAVAGVTITDNGRMMGGTTTSTFPYYFVSSGSQTIVGERSSSATSLTSSVVSGGAFRNPDTTNGNYSSLQFLGVTTTGAGITFGHIACVMQDHTNGSIDSDFAFVLRNNNSFAEPLRLKGDGNAGFNTTDQFGSGVKVIGIANATTAPTTNPTGGLVMYSASGAGKVRTSAGNVVTFAPSTVPAVTGSRGGNAALASLITELAGLGFVTDSSTA